MSYVTTFFRGLVYLIGLLFFSPLLIPSLLLGVIWACLKIGFVVGSNLLARFLLGFTVRRPASGSGSGLPSGIAFSRRHPKGSRH